LARIEVNGPASVRIEPPGWEGGQPIVFVRTSIGYARQMAVGWFGMIDRSAD
jgi:hypothetical protein